MPSVVLPVVLGLVLALWGATPATAPVVTRPPGAAPTDAPAVPLGPGAALVLATVAEPDAATGFPLEVGTPTEVIVDVYLPDRTPESTLGVDQLPSLSVEAPDGTFERSAGTERSPSTDVLAGETMVRVASLTVSLPTGAAVVAVSGPVPARVAVAVRPAGAPTGSPVAPDAATAAWLDAAPAATSTSVPEGDLDLSRLAGPRYDDSSPGRAAGLPLALGAVAIMAVVVVLVLRARGNRRGRPDDALYEEGPGVKG